MSTQLVMLSEQSRLRSIVCVYGGSRAMALSEGLRAYASGALPVLTLLIVLAVGQGGFAKYLSCEYLHQAVTLHV